MVVSSDLLHSNLFLFPFSFFGRVYRVGEAQKKTNHPGLDQLIVAVAEGREHGLLQSI